MKTTSILNLEKIKKMKKDKGLYLLLIVPVIYYLIFWYYPMAGLQIAFKDYKFLQGIWGSPWAKNFGMENFIKLFNSPDFIQIIMNTLILNIITILVSFPCPIILAILLYECRWSGYKRLVQSFSFLPFFISVAAVISIITVMLSPDSGIINSIISGLGMDKVYFRAEPDWFRPLYVITNVWQQTGYSAIIYLAALMAINIEIYDVAEIDGASRLQRVWYISLPSIIPTIVVLLILSIGKILNIGFERVLLLQTGTNLDVSETLQTFVYKSGVVNGKFSYATAVGIFERGVGLTLTIIFNSISSRLSKTSLW